ncbi:MAG: hypothetical protein KAJ01_07105 [Candidatus Hydrogenedentes bacterium]|nr:hypothetical protein [Candidatus Hydrogenedentota bacterium]
MKAIRKSSKVYKDAIKNVFRGPGECPYCGLLYGDFKTGETFGAVRERLWREAADPTKWKYKRRNTVLGLWHSLKQDLWEEHIEHCRYREEEGELEDDFEPFDEEF